MEPENDPSQRRVSWQGKSSSKPRSPDKPVVPLTPSARSWGRTSWREKPNANVSNLQSTLLLGRRIGLSVIAIGLAVTLIWTLLSLKHRVPIVAVFATTYRAPLGPIVMAEEDRQQLQRLSRSAASLFHGKSALFFDESPSLIEGSAKTISTALQNRLTAVRPGGPSNNMVVLYLSMLGTLNQDGKPCLIPPETSSISSHDEEESYLSLDTFLSEIRAALPARVGILVVLDACQPRNQWPLGVLDGGFAPAVEAAVEAAAHQRLWVMVSSGPGQVTHWSDLESSTPFAREFSIGFEGAADNKPTGNRDGKVDLGELAAYVTSAVDRWANDNRGERQTPKIFPAISPTTHTVPLAWATSWNPRTAAPISVDALPRIDHDWWLESHWKTAAVLRETVIMERPSLWQQYQQLLLRAEILRSAGVAYSDHLLRLETMVERIENDLRVSRLDAAANLPSFRLQALAEKNANRQSEESEILWKKELEQYVLSPPTDPAPKLKNKPTTDPGLWMLRARIARGWLAEQVEAGNAIDRTMLGRLLESIGYRPDQDGIEPLSLHLARMLYQWVDDEVWTNAPSLVGKLVRLASRSQDALYPSDVRTDAITRIFTPQIEARNKMRSAIDLTFVGDPASLARAAQLVEESDQLFSQVLTMSDLAARALRYADTVNSDLPWLTAWWVGEMRVLAISEESRAKNDFDPTAFRFRKINWEQLFETQNELNQVLQQSYDSSAQSNIKVTDHQIMQAISVARDRLELLYQPLQTAYADTCENLATGAPDTAQTLGAIERALAVPLIQGADRMRLLRRSRDLKRRFLFVTNPQIREKEPQEQPTGGTKEAVAGWVNWRETFVHPLVPIFSGHTIGEGAMPSDSIAFAKTAGMQLFSIREAARSLPAAIAEFEREKARVESSGDAGELTRASFIGDEELFARRLAVITGHRLTLEEVPIVLKNLAAAWHDRLLFAATSRIEDFWAALSADETPWYFKSARSLLEASVDIVRSTGIAHGDSRRRELEQRLLDLHERSLEYATLEQSPNRIILFPPDFQSDVPANRVHLSPARGVPAGIASLWLAPSVNAPPLVVAKAVTNTSDDLLRKPVARLPFPIGANEQSTELEWKIDSSGAEFFSQTEESVLDMVVWYRGHRIVRGLPVMKADAVRTIEWNALAPQQPRVTVRGDLPRNQSVAIVFDCSGSMGQKLLDGRTRMEAGREALFEVLDLISKAGGWNASLWLYGHRTQWSRDTAAGRYKAGLTAAGILARDTTVKDGKPFSLLPGNDVEQIIDMQPLSPVEVLRIRSLVDAIKPGGETPLYLAINEALRADFAGPNPGPGHILVVTDGANDQTGGTITTYSDVLRTLSRTNFRRPEPVRIDVIGFNLMPGKYDRELRLQELKSLAKDSAGKFFEATDPAKLAASLRQSLRIVRWHVEGGAASRQDVEIDEAFRLPLSIGGRTETYDVMLNAGSSSPRRRVAVSGAEGLELFVAGRGRGLEFRRYEGGTEQGLRDSQENLRDPVDPSRRWFIGAHLAKREGTTVSFPISLQNGDPTSFSPRPVEMWVEVTPKTASGVAVSPYIFYDIAYEPSRPVPVMNLVAKHWPAVATSANIKTWFRFVAATPEVSIAMNELVPGVERVFEIQSLPGSFVRMTVLPPTLPNELRLNVIETHPSPTAEHLPCLRVAVSPGCQKAVHITEPGTGRVRHEFIVATVDGQLASDVRVTISDRQRIVADAITLPLVDGVRASLGVPVPLE